MARIFRSPSYSDFYRFPRNFVNHRDTSSDTSAIFSRTEYFQTEAADSARFEMQNTGFFPSSKTSLVLFRSSE